MGDLGFFGILIPEDKGGMGLGYFGIALSQKSWRRLDERRKHHSQIILSVDSG